jgi:hypothetical protein
MEESATDYSPFSPIRYSPFAAKEEFPMRTLAWSILAVGTILAASPGQAQTYDPAYPVCLQIYDDIAHFYFECRYTSMAQCAASASGRAASCVVNPYFTKAPAKPGPRQKRPHKK